VNPSEYHEDDKINSAFEFTSEQQSHSIYDTFEDLHSSRDCPKPPSANPCGHDEDNKVKSAFKLAPEHSQIESISGKMMPSARSPVHMPIRNADDAINNPPTLRNYQSDIPILKAMTLTYYCQRKPDRVGRVLWPDQDGPLVWPISICASLPRRLLEFGVQVNIPFECQAFGKLNALNWIRPYRFLKSGLLVLDAKVRSPFVWDGV
jgi:hypothetical protein